MKLTIRQATTEDAQQAYRMINLLEDSIFDETLFQSYYTQCLLNPNHTLLIGQREDTTLAFGSMIIAPHLHHCGLVAEILELIVLPEARGSHIGSQMLSHFKDIAVTEGCVSLEVASNKKRLKAHAFYEKNGFTNSHYKLTQSLIL
ncbi:GNAT family N-acetyltransferase [Spirochaeta cellobiosiphila]|uniref:GNAT family N-acetyltransferase n=1 Tax=Spirochaeta cellobiosiphila TaxID=504483 RepID=UPI000403F838|nr:GNAT family N-acetyltransferase [Spirochaeta cellobiosiphila]